VSTRIRCFAALTIILWIASAALPYCARSERVGHSCPVLDSCCVGKAACPMKGHHAEDGVAMNQCHESGSVAVNAPPRIVTVVPSNVLIAPPELQNDFVSAAFSLRDSFRQAPEPPPPRSA
jgi:hypothetical protein